MVGVDTCVFHGFVKCGATGAITGIGNVLPRETLHFMQLSQAAAAGDATARRRAQELGEAFEVLSRFDEGADLVLYYKHLMVMEGNPEYALHFNPSDALSPSQSAFAETQLRQFKTWYSAWANAA
jgi:1-pyrroline-4-hydroxy-2-carboxylate deaminase